MAGKQPIGEQPAVTRSECPVCGAPRSEATPESPNYDLCSSCRVVYRTTFGRMRPEDEWDRSYYSDSRVVEHYLKRRSGFRKIVQVMNRLAGRRGKWLDVGCGVGVLLQLAHESGWEVHGIDRSRVCVASGSERMKYAHLVQGRIEETLGEFRGFNVLSLHDVLRFLERPGRILAGVRQALADRGWVLIRELKEDVERMNRAHEATRREATFNVPLQLWSPPSLERALRRAGFRNVRSIPSPVFAETGRYERDQRRKLIRTVERVEKSVAWPASRVVHSLTGGRVKLGPNFIALGQR